MINSSPEDIFNEFKDGKLDFSITIEKLLSIVNNTKDENLRIRISEIFIEMYRTTETYGSNESKHYKTFMEQEIGKKYINNYEIIPREAMALKLIELIIGRELENENGIPNIHHVHASFRINDKHVIDLDINEIGCSEIGFLDLFPNLEYLRISATDLREIKGFETLTNLKYLDLHGNNLKIIPNLGNLKNLKELYIDSNPLASISGIDKLRELRKFDLTETEIPKKAFERIYNSIPYNWFVRGVTQFNNHNYSNSIKSFKKAISLNPYYSEALYYLGIVYKKKNEFSKASKYYDRAIRNLVTSEMKILPPNLIFEDYKDNLITRASALKIYQALIEDGEYEHIRVESIKYYGELKPESNNSYEFLKSLVENYQDDEICRYASQILIKNFPRKIVKTSKNHV